MDIGHGSAHDMVGADVVVGALGVGGVHRVADMVHVSHDSCRLEGGGSQGVRAPVHGTRHGLHSAARRAVVAKSVFVLRIVYQYSIFTSVFIT